MKVKMKMKTRTKTKTKAKTQSKLLTKPHQYHTTKTPPKPGIPYQNFKTGFDLGACLRITMTRIKYVSVLRNLKSSMHTNV